MIETLALGETGLLLRQVFPVTPKRMWRAWTDAKQLLHWFMPYPDFRPTRAECVPEVGGIFRVEGIDGSDETLHGAGGHFVEVEPHTRLVFTWAFDRSQMEPGQSLVTVEFLPVEGGTEVRVTHERLASAVSRESHVFGWTNCLTALLTYIEEPST
ncbi:MAG: SRPBCC family protein [Fimbriimonas sp.]